MSTSSIARWSSLSLVLGGLMQLVIGPIQQYFPVSPPSFEFSIRNGLIVVTHALVLVGLIGLARSGAAGGSWLGKVGLGLAMIAGAAFIPAELSIPFNYQVGSTLDGICAMALGLGLILVGIAVLRARRWQGWGRFIPLLFGLYPFLLIIPFIAVTGVPNFVAIGGWGVPTLLLGVALRSESTTASAQQQMTHAAIR